MRLSRTRKDSTTPKLRWFVRNDRGEVFDGPFRSVSERDEAVKRFRRYGSEPVITQEIIECQTDTYNSKAARNVT